MAGAIVAELHRRAAAGIRFWPGPQPVASAAPMPGNDDDLAALIDDEIPW